MKTEDMSAIVTDIRDAIGNEKGITLTGASAISKDINTASQRDLMTAEAIGSTDCDYYTSFRFRDSRRFIRTINHRYRDCRILVRRIGDSWRKNGPYPFSS